MATDLDTESFCQDRSEHGYLPATGLPCTRIVLDLIRSWLVHARFRYHN
jgi:hypothetical protein